MQPSFDGERILAELGWVRGLAFRLVHDPGLAEDAAQEAWLIARERPPRATSERGLRAWLARVTHTLVRSRLRSERARERREAERRRPEGSVPATHEVVARTELQQRVVAAVMALPEPYRSAVLHKYVDGLSAHEIGLRQGTSAENARQRLARGLEMLRRDLDREFGNDGRAWAVALTGLLGDSGGGAATTLAGGLLAMKTSSLAVAALAATVLAIVLVARSSGPASAGRGETPPGATLASAPAADEPQEIRESRLVSVDAGRCAQPAAGGPAPARWQVRARLVDARGTPLPGAVLAVREDVERFAGVAGADGRVELEITGALPLVRDALAGPLLAFVARAAGCGESLRYEAPPAGGVLELGELRLYPIGALGGIVRDLAGRPIAGAEVRLTLPALGSAGIGGARARASLFGPPYALGERRGTTDVAGRFAFEQVSEGAWRAWAGAPGRR